MINVFHVIFVLGAGLAAFLAENKRSNNSLSAQHYTVSSEKIPKEFHDKKIIFISDLHNNQLGKGNKTLLALIKQEAPDYVFVGGDMLVSKRKNHSEQASLFMQKLASGYTVYCGNGNHEARLLWKEDKCPEAGDIYRNYIRGIKKAGVHHLYNETMKIEEEGSHIYISGLEIGERFYDKLKYQTMPVDYMKNRLGECEEDSFHVLLAHNPAYFETYAAWGADLTLSGHVHGGIMRLPFLGGVIAPSYELFPKYDAGLFRIGKKHMIVNVGLGSHSIKIRLFNPPKIDVITLKRERKQHIHE